MAATGVTPERFGDLMLQGLQMKDPTVTAVLTMTGCPPGHMEAMLAALSLGDFKRAEAARTYTGG